MNEDILIPLAMFASIVGIVWVVQAYISRNRRALLETVRAAIEKGVELSPELIKSLGAPRTSRFGDIKWGILLLAVAAAFLALGAAISASDGDVEAMYILSGVAAFPGFVGAALLAYGVVMQRLRKGD